MSPIDLSTDIIIIAFFMLLLTIVAYFFGRFLFSVFSGKISGTRTGIIERWIYRLTGTDPDNEQEWKEYGRDLLIFNLFGGIILFIILSIQGFLPLNPQEFGPVNPLIAINIVASFITNTNWQIYSGETVLSYLTQMSGLTVQNFLSAGTGICVAIAVMRGFTRKDTKKIGNFWVDLTRTVLYVLLPLAIIGAILLISQGVIQNFDPYIHTTGYGTAPGQILPMGPVASQESIKEIGTNGGGFFNANSAHPYENPTPFSNFLEIFLILLIPSSLPFAFGFFLQKPRQGFSLYIVMALLFLLAFSTLYGFEYLGNPAFKDMGITGIPMEGKEVRFGLLGSALFSTASTATSSGAVNTMYDSLTPLAGMVPMILSLLGEVVFGGVGSGFYTMIGFVIIAVFIAGLMIGRTPEYLGKKISVFEMKMAIVTILTSGVLVLILTALALIIPGGKLAMHETGAHGFSELLYAFASMANNNGSAFAGFDGTQFFYIISGSLVMLLGRFIPILAILALSGSVAGKKTLQSGPGTLPTDSLSFIIWIILVILIIGILTFFPFLAMGPVAEWFIMSGGI